MITKASNVTVFIHLFWSEQHGASSGEIIENGFKDLVSINFPGDNDTLCASHYTLNNLEIIGS